MKFSIKRSKSRKRLCLRFCALNGFEVLAPENITSECISGFIQDQRVWIEKQKSLALSYIVPEPLDFGYSIFLYGQPFRIVEAKSCDQFIKCFDSELHVHKDKNRFSKGQTSSEFLRITLAPWIEQQADEYLLSRFNFWVDYLTIINVSCRLKWLSSRWGSCSLKRNINLNRCLLAAPVDVLDYVIVHELCHLQEMNHSKKFWKLVKAIMPDFKDKVHWLKKYYLVLMSLNKFKRI